MQLTNTFRPRHQGKGRTHIKQRGHNQNTTSRRPKGQFLSPKIGQTAIQNKKFTRTYMQGHSMTGIVNHNRSKHLLGTVNKNITAGLNRFYVATTLAFSSAALVYTRHLLRPREGFLTHQCNISENIKLVAAFIWRDWCYFCVV